MPQPAFPTAHQSLLLDGPAGALEVVVDFPEPAEARPLVAVVCHPLPTEGGTMHNKVVTMVARALRELGATTVRFNFRGTGGSAGEFDDGRGEREDLRTVVDWVQDARPGDRLWLAGFSFGAYVTLAAAADLLPDAVISIAPPAAGRGWDFAAIPAPDVPWLVVQGDADEIIDPQAVYAWIDGLARKPQLVRMPDTSHFFHRKLVDLRGAIQHETKAWLPPA
ncbi:MAG: alpha/beta fold hydrolase [Pseudoxanthomonas sp.]|nr:alpha/beta fold hydrolase [Pseudoxanthomonas sp.]MBP9645253.1 alpha/beta fold hydrolase [Pseudoxanthomonas sp.]